MGTYYSTILVPNAFLLRSSTVKQKISKEAFRNWYFSMYDIPMHYANCNFLLTIQLMAMVAMSWISLEKKQELTCPL